MRTDLEKPKKVRILQHNKERKFKQKPKKIKMAKKKYEVTMIVECEEGHQKYIANAVSDGLEDETCVTYINVEETKKQKL